MAITFYVAGAFPLLVLGSLHLYFTLKDLKQPKIIVPRSPDLISRMQSDKLRLTRETTVWRAWLGFNISHSIAVLFVGATYMYLALRYSELLTDDIIVRWAGPMLACVFVVLSKTFWFSRPFYGSLVAALFMTIGAVVSTVS